jgi:outer membrane protein assembly factor BamB
MRHRLFICFVFPALFLTESIMSAEPATSESGVAEYSKPADVLSAGADWPQWGGTRFRNNVPEVTGLPATWNIGKFDRKTGDWDKSKAANINWFSKLGSQTYGNPVVADSQVYVGTNNGTGYLSRYPSEVDLGCLLAFEESTGKFLWQHSSEKLPTGRVHDWPLQGICCAPLIEGNRLWFVTSRGEVRCLDTKGFHDGEDNGPVKNEMAFVTEFMNSGPSAKAFANTVAGLDSQKLSNEARQAIDKAGEKIAREVTVKVIEAGKKWSVVGNFDGADRNLMAVIAGPRVKFMKALSIDDKDEADTMWIYDMMADKGVSQHNMCSCSVTSYGDLLFVITSNGVDESHIVIPSPDAPSFLCMDKNNGEVLWHDKSPGLNIHHGQWSSPAVAELGGVPQVIFVGGDGYLYSFKADRGQNGKGELLWKFDSNPKTAKLLLGGEGTRNDIIGTPVIYNDLVYVAVGQDPEHGEGEGRLWCIDPTKRGDVSPTLSMKVEGGSRTPIPHRRIQAVVEKEGDVEVDNPNSAAVWNYDLSDNNKDGEIDFEEEMHRTIGSCAIKDDVLYIADLSGLIHCLDAKGSADGKAIVHFTYDMLAQSWGSPLIADGKVYIGDEDGDLAVFEFGSENAEPIEEISMGSSVYTTPIAANGKLFISTKDKLFCIEKK